jgi:hypothetical protein
MGLLRGGLARVGAGPLLALQAALALIQLAPLWALGWALVAGIRPPARARLGPGELALHAGRPPPGSLFMAIPILLLHRSREARPSRPPTP